MNGCSVPAKLLCSDVKPAGSVLNAAVRRRLDGAIDASVGCSGAGRDRQHRRGDEDSLKGATTESLRGGEGASSMERTRDARSTLSAVDLWHTNRRRLRHRSHTLFLTDRSRRAASGRAVHAVSAAPFPSGLPTAFTETPSVSAISAYLRPRTRQLEDLAAARWERGDSASGSATFDLVLDDAGVGGRPFGGLAGGVRLAAAARRARAVDDRGHGCACLEQIRLRRSVGRKAITSPPQLEQHILDDLLGRRALTHDRLSRRGQARAYQVRKMASNAAWSPSRSRSRSSRSVISSTVYTPRRRQVGASASRRCRR